MLFCDFASYLEKLEETSSRNEMTEILADLFKKASLEEIDKICYLSLGRLLPKFTGLEFQMAEKMLIKAIALAYEIEEKKVRGKYKRRGDLGEVAFELATKKSSHLEDFGGPTEVGSNLDSHLLRRIPQEKKIVKSPNIQRVELAGFAPAEPWVRIQVPYSSSPTRNLSYQKIKLNVNEVYEKLMRVAKETGKGSVERKINGLGELLRQLEPLSAKYVVRIPLGRLRLGFSDMTILDALSWLVKGDKSGREELEKAYSVAPDAGELGKKVKTLGIRKAVSGVKPKLGVPVLPMLAQRLKSPAEMIEKMGKVAVEPKFDGLRLQIHVWKEKVPNLCSRGHQVATFEMRIFSRNLENVTPMFPEVVAAAQKLAQGRERRGGKVQGLILDGEAVGVDSKTGKFLPFQETIQRKRKHGILAMAKKIPVKVFLFDILFFNGESLMEKNYLERRQALEKVLRPRWHSYSTSKVVQLVDYQLTDNSREISRLNRKYRKKGLEGIIIKKLTSGYVPGRTGWRWVKMKEGEEAVGKLPDTLDCVVMGYYLGKGKRTGFGVGAFLVGILAREGREIRKLRNYEIENFLTIAKIGTGLTDEEWKELKVKSQKLKVKSQPKEYLVSKDLAPDFWLLPELVVEVAGDDLTKSPIHTSGHALRFPRLVAFRDDKSPVEATTLEEVHRLFHLQ